MDFTQYTTDIWKEVKASSTNVPHWLIQETLEEAEFGYEALKEDLLKAKGQPILELGGGPMMLATFLAINDWNITSVEPRQPGFTMYARVRKITEKVLQQQRKKMAVLNGHAETVTLEQNTYGYAYCVNVMEHVEHPSAFLQAVQAALKPKGCLRALAANYTFPYDTHFGIPIIFTKQLTHKVFRRKTQAIETIRNEPHLWDSIFFITPRKVGTWCKALDMPLHFSANGFSTLLRTLLSKPQFSQRHPILSPVFRVLLRLGLLRVVRFLPATLNPYMDFTAQKRAR